MGVDPSYEGAKGLGGGAWHVSALNFASQVLLTDTYRLIHIILGGGQYILFNCFSYCCFKSLSDVLLPRTLNGLSVSFFFEGKILFHESLMCRFFSTIKSVCSTS